MTAHVNNPSIQDLEKGEKGGGEKGKGRKMDQDYLLQ